jgi:hypothetical protein
MLKLATFFTVLASPVWAICDVGEDEFMSCQIENSTKSVAVCFNNWFATYRYGVAGQMPELSLQSTIADLKYEPWNGSGRSIWEVVRFENEGYTYEVMGGFDRLWDDQTEEDIAPAQFGSVSVWRGSELVVDLECNRQTVSYTWDVLLWDAKTALGYRWDERSLVWTSSPD